MQERRWTSYDLIFFDCDSTLSTIEGIDELAKLKGKEWRVGLLTQKAMDGELDLEQVYGKRLQAIRPTRGQLKAIEERYWQTIVEDVPAVLAALRYIQREIFIISGGLAEPVKGFGQRLGVPASNIRAVEVEYNQLSGDWWRFYEPNTQHTQTYLDFDDGPLTITAGKPDIIRELSAGKSGRRLMIGDGSSDLATRDVVDLFVGFGGVVARQNVIDGADVFIHTASIAPLLPIAAGKRGYKRVIGTPHQAIFDKGIALAQSDGVSMRADLRQAFTEAFGHYDDTSQTG